MIALAAAAAAFRRRVGAVTTRPDPNRTQRAYAVTVITPIADDRTDDLRKLLQGFGGPSPLASLQDVHFARWVIVDGLYTKFPGAPKDSSTLASDYLLLTADLTAPAYLADGFPRAFFRELIRIPEVRDVWGHCQGFPGTESEDACIAYLADRQVRTALYYAAFPNATVAEIKVALDVRRELTDFIRRHQADAPATLQNLKTAYLKESEQWPHLT